MKYNIENYCEEYRNLLAQQEEIKNQRGTLDKILHDLREEELDAKEAWLEAELLALGNPGQAAQVEKLRLAYRETQNKRTDFEEKLSFFQESSIPLKRMLYEARDKAQRKAQEAARADHEKLIPKIIKVMRELAELQVQEAEIIQAAPMGDFRLYPSYRLMKVPLGNEKDINSRMYMIVKNLRDLGYHI